MNTKSRQLNVPAITMELYHYQNNDFYWQIFETSIAVDSGVLNKILLIFALFGHLQFIKHFVLSHLLIQPTSGWQPDEKSSIKTLHYF